MFRKLYDWTMRLSRKPGAPWYLFGFSAAESVFFPVPTDVMLAPMVMAQRERWLRLAVITTAGSILGALIGYPLGYFSIEALTPLLKDMGYWHAFETAQAWFAQYGFWALFVAGFTPIPFKVFTVAAGAAAMPLLPFVVACFFGRFARFGLVAGVVRVAGPAFEQRALRYIDAIGWATLGLILVAVAVWKLA